MNRINRVRAWKQARFFHENYSEKNQEGKINYNLNSLQSGLSNARSFANDGTSTPNNILNQAYSELVALGFMTE
ncbi:hypothetical protein EMGBS15_03540 [Filimonas sp.]|nr:hypothetical protein EMGBS15_03540 [Filimonas sp.]